MSAHAKNAPVRADQFPCNHGTNHITAHFRELVEKVRLCACQLESGQFLLEPLHRSQSTKEKTFKILQDSFVGTIRSDQNILATCTETILFQKVQFAVFTNATNTFEK